MPLTYSDLADAFGPDNVVRADPEALAELGLPAEARRVLTEVGLPRSVGDRAIEAVPPSLFDVPDSGRRYCRVCQGVANDFALDLSTGEVWRLSRNAPAESSSFVNSNLSAFVESLTRYGTALNQMPEDRDDEESAEWAARLEEQLRVIDPRCLTEPDAYFAGVVFDIRIGVL